MNMLSPCLSYCEFNCCKRVQATFPFADQVKWQIYFQFSKILHNVFHIFFTVLHTHQQCIKVPFSLYPFQQILFLNFWMLLIPTGMTWYLVILICLSLIVNGPEHCCMYLLVIHIASFEICLFISYAHFLIGLFVLLSFLVFVGLDTYPSLEEQFINIVSHSVVCLFSMLTVSFTVQKFLNTIYYFAICISCLCLWGLIQDVFAQANILHNFLSVVLQ